MLKLETESRIQTPYEQEPVPQNVWEKTKERQIIQTQENPTTKPDLSNMKIMVVDDVPLNIKLACSHLKVAGYKNFITQSDSTKALTQIYQESPDVLLLDIMMPEVSGLSILEAVRADQHFSHLPILILTASTETELKNEALELGATDFLNKPIDARDMLPRVRNALMMKMHQDHLESLVRQRTAELQEAQREVVHCLACASEYRDNETGNHVVRVSLYVEVLAREVGFDSRQVEMIKLASTLHDMGKIGIPDSILLKPGKLTDEEFSEMKNHCDYGEKICSRTGILTHKMLDTSNTIGTKLLENSKSPLLKLASIIAATHHEKWDGSGYPKGLKGEEIPIEGRIVAIADVFDALSSKRPYKEPFPIEKCIAILEEGKGTHFDAELVDLFLGQMDEIIAIRDTHGD